MDGETVREDPRSDGGAEPSTTARAGAGMAEVAARRLRRGLRLFPWPRARRRAFAGDAQRVVTAARALAAVLPEFGCEGARVPLIRERADELEFTVECPLGDADVLARRRHDLARRLDCWLALELAGRSTAIIRLRESASIAAAVEERGRALPVPVGSDRDGIVYLDLAAVGSVGVFGRAGECARLVRSWVVAVEATISPGEAVVRADPEIAEGSCGREDEARRPEILAGLARARRDGTIERVPALVAALDLERADREALDELVREGPAVGIYPIGVGAEDEPGTPTPAGGWGAELRVGGALALEAGEDASRSAPPGAMQLRLPNAPPLILEPLVVVSESPERVAEPRVPPAVTDCASGAPVRSATDPAGPTAGSPPGRVLPDRAQPASAETAPPGAASGLPWTDGPSAPARADERAPDRATPTGDADEDAPEDPDRVTRAREHEPSPGHTAVDGGTPLGPQPDPGGGEESPARHDGSREHRAGRQEALPLGDEDVPPADDGGPPGHFTVRCFGEFHVEYDGHELHWPLLKARELLAYLLAGGDVAVPRDEAAEALWPEESPGRVGKALRDAAHLLRKTLQETGIAGPEERFFTALGQRYRLRAQLFRVDVDAFVAHIARAHSLAGAAALREYERAVALYAGDFLANEPWDWAEQWRAGYRKRYVSACREGAALALELRAVDSAAGFYDAILASEPIDEDAARGLMRCYARRHDLNGLRKVYRTLTEALRRELDDDGAEPSPESEALLRELLARPDNA